MAGTDGPAIVWFREDLRLDDHPALFAAAARGTPLLCVYVFDEESPNLRPLGGAARWWLHHSLASLAADLAAIGGRLDILRGPAGVLIPELARRSGTSAVHWTRRYGAAEIAIDTAIKAELEGAGIPASSSNGRLLHEPWTVKPASGPFFRVFTPFWRAARALPLEAPVPAPAAITAAPWSQELPPRIVLDDLTLLPRAPDWSGGLAETWRPGEGAARARLAAFVDAGLKDYAKGRDAPGGNATSRLSPHLRFGEISSRRIFAAVWAAREAGRASDSDVEKFLSELGWREFSHHLLFHCPDLATRNFQARFDAFPWRTPTREELAAWRKGWTGYPIVDAGMRELWRTGIMHNRVRMICASFLVKHLLVDWRIGEDWFWDTLCDADPANNAASWQWVAGSGADAAPYFRIFNPVLQGEKFDPDGTYVRRFVPELARLPSAWIHKPWQAPAEVLRSAGVTLGVDYPAPIVDHAAARGRALAAFRSLGGS